MNTAITASNIKQATSRMNVALLALNWSIDDKRKEYYSRLDKDDLPGNIEILFNDLTAIYSMLIDEVMELEDYRLRLMEEESNVQ